MLAVMLVVIYRRLGIHIRSTVGPFYEYVTSFTKLHVYIMTYRKTARGGRSQYGRRQHEQKLGEVRMSVFDASGQTDRQTNRQTSRMGTMRHVVAVVRIAAAIISL